MTSTHPMNPRALKSTAACVTFAALAVMLPEARAVPVVPGSPAVTLPGTTVAARPELAGTVLEDVTTPWASIDDPMYGFPGAEGQLQSRVVRETATGTLDFYWRLFVNGSSYPNFVPTELDLADLALGSFATGSAFDADDRLDGLGGVGATGFAADASHFAFGVQLDIHDPGNTSYFLLLHSNATTYDDAASATFGVTTVSTFRPIPAVPEPLTYAMLIGGLAAVGWYARKRRR